MRNVLISIISIMVSLLPLVNDGHSQPGWLIQDSGTSQNLNSVHFVNGLTGTAVGDFSTILRTTDGGETWGAQSCQPETFLQAVSFSNANHGMAVGQNGTIIHTTNGGANWLTSQDGWMITYYGAHMLSSEYGYAVGVNTIFQPLVTFSSDGWQSFDHSVFYLEHNGGFNEGNLRDVIFTDAFTGYAAAIVWTGEGAIARTNDGGANWETVYWNDDSLLGINFPISNASLVGYAVGDFGTILKTTNGGNTWLPLNSGQNGLLWDVWFSDFDNGTVVGDNGLILRTNDGGLTWRVQDSGTSANLKSVCFATADTGTVVGEGGIILHTTTGGQPLAVCSIGMIPDNPPIQIPAGSSFTYTGILTNNTNVQQTTDVAVMLDVPGYGLFGPVKLYQNVSLAPHQEIIIPGIIQDVPLYAPPGLYTYIAYCGDFPSNPLDSASFEFTVILSVGGGLDPRVLGASPQPTAGFSEWALSDWFNAIAEEQTGKSILANNYPNPFNARTEIRYYLPVSTNVRLEVYNILGERIEVLIYGMQEAGNHKAIWDASNYSSGIYFYKLVAGDEIFTKRMTVLK